MRGNPSSAEDNRALLLGLLVAVCILGFALRLHALSADSLWIDEISTATRSLLDPRSLLRALPSFGVGVELPLIYVVTHFFVLSLGDSEFILRMPAVLFGALSILLVYKVGALLWTRQEGLVAATLLSLSAYHVGYSQEARHYALLVFLALLSLIFLLMALQRNRIHHWAAFALCMTLSLYTHYFAFLFLAAAVAFGAFVLLVDYLPVIHQDRPVSTNRSARGRRALDEPLVRFFASLALIALAYLPWLPALVALISSQAGSELAGASLTSAYSSVSFLHEVLANYTGVGGVVLLLFAGVAVAGLATAGWPASALALLWMGIPFGFFALVGSDHQLHPRYVLFVLPVYLLVMARGVVSLTGILRHRLRNSDLGRIGLLAAASGFALLFALTSALSLRSYYSSLKEDWRSAASYVANDAQPGDLVLVDGRKRGIGDAKRVERGLSYYLARHGAADLQILPAQRGLWDALWDSAGSEGRVWAVVWSPGQLGAEDPVIAEEFHQLAVLRLLDPSGDALQDTVSMLQALLSVLPSEADFDVLLALAELHQRTGSCEHASLVLHRANRLKPQGARASEDLREALAEWEEVCSGQGNLERALWRNLGDRIAFLGYEVDPQIAQPGGTLRVTVRWQALSRMDRDYTAFIHFTDEEGRLWTQDDRLLQDNHRLTSTWRPATVVKQEFQLQLPPDLPSGEYNLVVGVYHWETGERLPVLDEPEREALSDAISLQRLPVSD